MAHLLRPLMQWPRWRHRHTAFFHLLTFHSSSPRASNTSPFLLFSSISFPVVNFQSRPRRLGDVSSRSVPDESDDDSANDTSGFKKSRNQKKREAQRAVRWGMELASFSPSQIKLIVSIMIRYSYAFRAADLEQEVYEAVMLVKRLGRDVREGKRRQFNYIGRLLRDVEPELIDGLIQATKDGDQSKFHIVPVTETSDIHDEEKEEEEIEQESDEEDSINIDVATRWYDGLINKDFSITNEIYSLQKVEFDRQELRRLVSKVHSTTSEDNAKADAVNARRSLTRFLRDLVKQLPPHWYLSGKHHSHL